MLLLLKPLLSLFLLLLSLSGACSRRRRWTSWTSEKKGGAPKGGRHSTIYYNLLYLYVYYTIPYHTIPCYTILYHTILYYTILWEHVPFLLGLRHRGEGLREVLGKGQVGSALMGSLRIVVLFDGGTFGVLPLTYFYLLKSARVHLFPQSVEIHYSCHSPISVDPICPQPTRGIAHIYIYIYRERERYGYIYIYIIYAYIHTNMCVYIYI